MAPESHFSCLHQVKKYDRENYLAGLCIEDMRVRRAVIALRAFNVELSLIRDKTTDTDRAKIRFLFWSKLIDEIKARNHKVLNESDAEKADSYYKFTPVAKELIEVFQYVDFDDRSEKYMKDMIGARISPKVLGYESFKTMEDLELYCSKSNSSLYQLAGWISCQLNEVSLTNSQLHEKCQTVAYELGLAHGLVNVIRAIPYNATKGCCYVPESTLNDTGLTLNDFRLNLNRKNLDDVKAKPAVACLANRCQNILNRVHLMDRSLPNFLRVLFLPRVTVQSYLNKLHKCDYQICSKKLQTRNELLPFSLWLAKRFTRAPIF